MEEGRRAVRPQALPLGIGRAGMPPLKLGTRSRSKRLQLRVRGLRGCALLQRASLLAPCGRSCARSAQPRKPCLSRTGRFSRDLPRICSARLRVLGLKSPAQLPLRTITSRLPARPGELAGFARIRSSLRVPALLRLLKPCAHVCSPLRTPASFSHHLRIASRLIEIYNAGFLRRFVLQG